MKLSFALLLGLMGSLLPAAPASAQLAGYALYDVGAATTELGSDKGRSKLVYGMGAGASYGVLSMGDLRFVVGADLLVRGFGLEVPARVDLDTGVFDQSDVWLDQYVAFRFRSVMAGVYFEQRSIDRGRAGTIGLPASGVGLLAEISWGERVTARISHAGFASMVALFALPSTQTPSPRTRAHRRSASLGGGGAHASPDAALAATSARALTIAFGSFCSSPSTWLFCHTASHRAAG